MNEESDTPLFAVVNKVFTKGFCNFLTKIFLSWSFKTVLVLVAGTVVILFVKVTIDAVPEEVSGVVGEPATV